MCFWNVDEGPVSGQWTACASPRLWGDKVTAPVKGQGPVLGFKASV